MWKTYPFEAGEVCCQKTSISFVDSIWEILGPLLQGIKTVIISDEVVKEPRLFIKYLADEEITRVITVPSYLRVMLDTYPDLQERLPKLKLWISSGEALSKELYQRFREKLPQSLLLNLYGSSEVSADVTWYDTDSTNRERPSVPIGRPIANTQVYILDPYLQPVPIGVSGELHIGGENLAAGYLNHSELTENAFIPDPFNDKPNSRLFKTGDKGRWLPDGNIEFIRRVDHQVKIRGFRIEPGEVEAVLNKYPDVKESIVLAREDRPNDKRLVAYIVLRRKPAAATRELNRFLKQNLPDYMLPSAFVFLDALPLTPSGKVDRKALPAPDQNRSQPVETLVAPRDELELQLTKTWEKVLGVQPIGVSDNFFELGGHSLLAVRLFVQIEKILGKNLPLSTLFQEPTVEQIAIILREQGWSAPSFSLDAIENGDAGFANVSHKITKHIPAKCRPYLKQQYLKVKQHPGYLYFRRQYIKAKSSFTKRFLSYRPSQLEEKLREIGLTEADTVYMHSAFNAVNGFSGGPQQIIDCILNVIGGAGNLLMVSMAYTGFTDDYLKENKTFDVIKTESSMGIITEIFRRTKGVVRSLNAAHPILAFGPNANWIISDHDRTRYSCGKGSPFEKILKLDAKALFFDVPFWTMTFFHYLEDKFKDRSPVKLYDDEPLESTVIDSKGNEIRVKTYVFSKEARETRSARHIERKLKKNNLLKTDTIGNTKLTLVNLRDVVGVAQELVNAGIHFYK
jgi:aminoglycoside N3'-acetyltransferase/acyl carrier protein